MDEDKYSEVPDVGSDSPMDAEDVVQNALANIASDLSRQLEKTNNNEIDFSAMFQDDSQDAGSGREEPGHVQLRHLHINDLASKEGLEEDTNSGMKQGQEDDQGQKRVQHEDLGQEQKIFYGEGQEEKEIKQEHEQEHEQEQEHEHEHEEEDDDYDDDDIEEDSDEEENKEVAEEGEVSVEEQEKLQEYQDQEHEQDGEPENNGLDLSAAIAAIVTDTVNEVQKSAEDIVTETDNVAQNRLSKDNNHASLEVPGDMMQNSEALVSTSADAGDDSEASTASAGTPEVTDAMTDVIQQMVNETVSQVAVTETSADHEANGEVAENAAEQLISGAVNEVIKSVASSDPERSENEIRPSLADAAISEIVKGVVAQTSALDQNAESQQNLAESAISQIVQNVVDQLPESSSTSEQLLASTHIITQNKEHEPPSGTDLQFAIQEMVKNVVDETFDDLPDSIGAMTRRKSVSKHNAGTFSSSQQSLNQGSFSQFTPTKNTGIPLTTSQKIQEILSKHGSQNLGAFNATSAVSLLNQQRSFLSTFKPTTLDDDDTKQPSISEIIQKNFPQLNNLSSYLQYKNSFASTEGPLGTTSSSSKDPVNLDTSQVLSGVTAEKPVSSIAQAINSAIQAIMNVQKPVTEMDEKERIRLENRSRKQKWREKNNIRNKDNDLRFRVHKRAEAMFGPGDSDAKKQWIDEEFEKRRLKRLEKSKKAEKDDKQKSNVMHDALLNLNYSSDAATTKNTYNFANTNGSIDPRIGTTITETEKSENSEIISNAITNALNAAKISIPHERFTGIITSFISNFLANDDSLNSRAKADATQKIEPPKKIPDRDLTNFVKSGKPLDEVNKGIKRKLIEKDKGASFKLPTYKRPAFGSRKTGLGDNIKLELTSAAATTNREGGTESTVSGLSGEAMSATRPPARRFTRPAAKKPSILSSLTFDGNKNGTSIRPKVGSGIFRRPVYKSSL